MMVSVCSAVGLPDVPLPSGNRTGVVMLLGRDKLPADLKPEDVEALLRGEAVSVEMAKPAPLKGTLPVTVRLFPPVDTPGRVP